ncbi:hypothetical protein TVAG_167830 [Trichomonas vaginalis G3]|uniref:Hemerythrin-like domain-containing protein n=1 Tax=Trichomonas vaginalis (strain ATCC PRA-98 / G3) TaxID=412133 RepID=A2FLC1_TRIV3|nr:protein of unknown function (DUF542) [Trichomonas vaginalis G3]EAX94302.1 hypothetical protein TVAG_167830 [Trichomonas vaginalis G3]KAI5510348.1 protein of unknown function (DUF542) [Trichomonas vaginalis G3]|eukprot:XP_001307232.1 hypothetical protein [Trichomonas vaginalis G3]
MDKASLAQQSVGSIVANSFSTANVFAKFGIDFCCHGYVKLLDACKTAKVPLDTVYDALMENEKSQKSNGIEFSKWPLDLLIDYVLKTHHRNIRKYGPETLKLISKVVKVHGEKHPELHEVKKNFLNSLNDLENHLQKEEQVLFPFVYQLCEADAKGLTMGRMHCMTVDNPIRVMMEEHENEGARYFHMAKLTNNYTAPADGCNSYKLAYSQIKQFNEALFEHIHIENNLIFPQASALEKKIVFGAE